MNYKITDKYFVDINKLKEIEEKYNLDIVKISKKTDKDINLKDKFEQRLKKYKNRLSTDYKIKIKKIEPIYIEWLNKINNYFNNINGNINFNDLKNIHKLFFPKNIWGETRDPKGNIYYSKYPAGSYRKHNEFVTVNNINYEYLKPDNIEDSINNLFNWFDNDNQSNTFLKIILFYIILSEIHPFYNGNGTISLLITNYLLKENGYDFNITNFFNTLSTQEELSFFKKGISGDYELIIKMLIHKYE